jgi:hypothetical protein
VFRLTRSGFVAIKGLLSVWRISNLQTLLNLTSRFNFAAKTLVYCLQLRGGELFLLAYGAPEYLDILQNGAINL